MTTQRKWYGINQLVLWGRLRLSHHNTIYMQHYPPPNNSNFTLYNRYNIAWNLEQYLFYQRSLAKTEILMFSSSNRERKHKLKQTYFMFFFQLMSMVKRIVMRFTNKVQTNSISWMDTPTRENALHKVSFNSTLTDTGCG